MFDTNKFKRAVKDWLRDNPHASLDDLTDFCEELIPPGQFSNYSWLLEQTTGWYQHVLETRKSARIFDEMESEDVA